MAERSEAVNSKLQLRRDQIEELSQVKGLQVVFDLPRRLRAALDAGAHEVAADAYSDAAPLLKRYGHKVGHTEFCKRIQRPLLKCYGHKVGHTGFLQSKAHQMAQACKFHQDCVIDWARLPGILCGGADGVLLLK